MQKLPKFFLHDYPNCLDFDSNLQIAAGGPTYLLSFFDISAPLTGNPHIVSTSTGWKDFAVANSMGVGDFVLLEVRNHSLIVASIFPFFMNHLAGFHFQKTLRHSHGPHSVSPDWYVYSLFKCYHTIISFSLPHLCFSGYFHSVRSHSRAEGDD